jgi:hypothetical protein
MSRAIESNLKSCSKHDLIYSYGRAYK